jgi:hypothetical protein
MKIKMLKNFGGVLTNEKRIVEGVYESDDPSLFGIADYLVDNGHAVIVADASGQDKTVVTKPKRTRRKKTS